MDPRCIEASDNLVDYMSTTGLTLYVHNEDFWMEHKFYNHWLDDCAEFRDIDFGSASFFLDDWNFYDFRDCRIIAFATFCAELQAPNSGVPLFCDFRDGDLLNPEIFSIQDQEIMRSVLKVLIKVESQNPLSQDSPLRYYKVISRSLYRKIARRKAAQGNQQQ